MLLLVTLLIAWVNPLSTTAQDNAASSAEEQLAQKYAPVVYLKRQDVPCDPGGEPYLPAPVDIAFDDPKVVLRRFPDRQEVAAGPGDADLFAPDPTLYLDLPGTPEEPLCTYETHARERMGNQAPVVYAHIAVEPGQGLALQYWFWYYFNDFNDKHESDWEMIQLRFDAESAAAALQLDPVSVAFSQHNGGEIAAWDDPKLRKEDGHPVTFPSRGSHGNYYAPAIWLGWGENGSGFGCDNTTAPLVRITPEVRLIPDAIKGADDPFAWAAFGGHWGDREMWLYDGPPGPNVHEQWSTPITWSEQLRHSSINLQDSDAIGPTPAAVFCNVARVGSDLYAQFRVRPAVILGLLGALLALLIWLVWLAHPVLRGATRIYAAHPWTFISIGAMLIPAGLIANGLHAVILATPPVSALVEVTERAPLITTLIALTAGNFQHLVMTVLVGPAVIQAIADIQAGEQPGMRRAYAAVGSNLSALIGAGLRALLITLALVVTIIGIPWAIARLVRWSWFGQAVMLDGASGSGALAASAGVVRGHWWRVLGISVLLLFVGSVLGPLIGIPVMIAARAPLELVNGLSSVIYAFTHPFAVIGSTILYQQLKDRR